MPVSQPKPVQVLRRSLTLIIQAAPSELRLLTLVTLISGVGPVIALFLNKIIIDHAAILIQQESINSPLKILLQEPLLLGSIFGILIINLLGDITNNLTNFTFSALRDRVRGFTQKKLLDKIANFPDIALFETPELLNLTKLTEKGINRLEELSFILMTTLNGIFIFIPAVFLSISIVWWIPIILCLTSSPAIYYELSYREKTWRVEETQADFYREMELYKTVLTHKTYAKELRLFHLQDIFIGRWLILFKKTFNAMQKIREKGSYLVICWSIISGFGVGIPYFYVILGTLNKQYSLGDLALYAGLILQIRQSLFILINNASDAYEIILGTTPIFQVLDLSSTLKVSLPPSDLHSPASETFSGIIINNLSFTYPGSDKLILNNLNFRINTKEIIAIVGENGAGKTTLTKLLCRLYDPDNGIISWKGKDLRQWDWEELHNSITVVMQDYSQFPATIRENIGFGYLPLLDDNARIETTLEKVGMNDIIKSLSLGLETPLGREWEGGIELSQGQWQKIAIARALLRLPQAELLIFDEPTAALDAKTEYEIYQIFRTLASNKMAVVISHRLALCKLVDRIVVLENGQIIEEGTHQELMAKSGRYHLMFTRQASSYQ
ncbi:ABC transporter ATP-binding protein [Crocosphaera sp. XPORK-15E]|uniref:ABC transporter ATP-binding protein n=1 Tax=Crocosphaera sp. XPORK-15E TaxID=3110247 RepID=UPI002B215318|nr:ABC transporter ATP-binding protein [Crocosphaera sp. XPORK-15E]MEA5535557.1 ABC transporter ATP-binding protein [Crocosphaera sp. XPORK-15E]